jgi:hypothetical protein
MRYVQAGKPRRFSSAGCLWLRAGAAPFLQTAERSPRSRARRSTVVFDLPQNTPHRITARISFAANLRILKNDDDDA